MTFAKQSTKRYRNAGAALDIGTRRPRIYEAKQNKTKRPNEAKQNVLKMKSIAFETTPIEIKTKT